MAGGELPRRASARLGLKVPEPPRLEGDETTYFVQTARLHAVQGKREMALQELAQGLALGHGERRHIRDDPDFESLREDPESGRLVTEGPPSSPAHRHSVASARSATSVTIAFAFGFIRSIQAVCADMTSRAEALRARVSAARSTAVCEQRWRTGQAVRVLDWTAPRAK